MLEQFKRSRGGNGKCAMGADNSSAADVQRRAYPFVDAQSFRANRGADNIHNGVNRADFVEMDLLDVSVVNLGFRHSQGFKDLYSPIFRRLADARGMDDLADFLQPAMGVLRSMCMRVL